MSVLYPLKLFSRNVKKMYNIYETHGEKMAEEAKIRFLFRKIHHVGLSSAIEAMKAKITTDPPGTVTYTTVANHLSTAVSELPDFIAKNRNISSVGGGSSNGIHNADGSINTGHHPNWQQLSVADRKTVNDERARLGLGRNKKQKGGKPATYRNPKAENQIK